MPTARETFAGIDDIDTLQKKWHRLLRKYHPDTSQNPEEQNRLTTLTQEINAAYTQRKEALEEEAKSTFAASHQSPNPYVPGRAQYPGGLTFEQWMNKKMSGG